MTANDYGIAYLRQQYADLRATVFTIPKIKARSMAMSLLHFTKMAYNLPPEAQLTLDHAESYIRKAQ